MRSFIIIAAIVTAHTKSWAKGDIVPEAELLANGADVELWRKNGWIALDSETPTADGTPAVAEAAPSPRSFVESKAEFIARRDRELAEAKAAEATAAKTSPTVTPTTPPPPANPTGPFVPPVRTAGIGTTPPETRPAEPTPPTGG